MLADPDAYRRIGEDVTELLDIVPMKFIKKRIVRPRYVRKDDWEQPPVSAPLPARVLSGGLPAVRLLVHVLLAKYVDHLPLYRISGIFKQRYGVQLSRQTMADSVATIRMQKDAAATAICGLMSLPVGTSFTTGI